MTPEMWTIIGVGVALSSIGTGGFTLLRRYIAAAEKRSEDRAAAIEKRADARIVELRADIRMLAERMERNHADLRHAIDTLVLDDQAKRLTILEEAVLRSRGAGVEDDDAYRACLDQRLQVGPGPLLVPIRPGVGDRRSRLRREEDVVRVETSPSTQGRGRAGASVTASPARSFRGCRPGRSAGRPCR